MLTNFPDVHSVTTSMIFVISCLCLIVSLVVKDLMSACLLFLKEWLNIKAYFVVYLGVAGLFTMFSSFVFSIGVINIFGSDLTGLK